MTWHSASMSSLDTRRILGSSGRLSWISCGFAWLLRFDDGVTERVASVGDKTWSKGDKTRFDALPPIGIILNLVGVGAIGSDRDTMLAGLAGMEFEGMDGCSVDKVRNSPDVFELIGHMWGRAFPKPLTNACQILSIKNWNPSRGVWGGERKSQIFYQWQPSPPRWISLSSIGNHEKPHVGMLISIFVKWSSKPASSSIPRTGFTSIHIWNSTNRQSRFPRPKNNYPFLNTCSLRRCVKRQRNLPIVRVISITRVQNGRERVMEIIDGSPRWDVNWRANIAFDFIKSIHVKHMWNGCMQICRQPFNVFRDALLSWPWRLNIRIQRIRLYPIETITGLQRKNS